MELNEGVSLLSVNEKHHTDLSHPKSNITGATTRHPRWTPTHTHKLTSCKQHMSPVILRTVAWHRVKVSLILAVIKCTRQLPSELPSQNFGLITGKEIRREKPL